MKHEKRPAPQLTPEENRRAWLLAALIVALLLALGAGIAFLLIGEQEEPTRLPAASETLMAASEGLDAYVIDGVLDAENRTLTFTQTMALTNRTGQEQSAVVLRSWTGAYLSEDTSPCASEELFLECYGATFSPGGLTVTAADVEGAPVDFSWLDEARTVLSLPVVWPAEGSVTVTLRCEVTIPACASRFGYAERDGAAFFMLGNVFPTPAVWEDGAWRTDAYAAIGDPFLSECANWRVTLTLPEGFTAAASAPGTRDGAGRYAFEGLALRDFALVVSDGFSSASAMAGDTLVTAWARTEAAAKDMLRYAQQALLSYERRWSEYAYPAYTVAEAVFPYGGMEYPGLAMIASDVIAGGGQTLEYVVAHETAHQWWAVMVGSDGWYQPWQDESLCEYAWLDYVGDYYGDDDREQMAFDRIEASLRITIPGGVTPGSPLDYFSDLTQYSRVVYQRGAAFWRAMELHLGKEELDACLRAYQAQYRFRIATREELTALLSQYAGMDIAPLMLDYLDTLMN